MRRLMLWGLNHPWLTIFLTLGITIFAVYQALHVHVDSSTEGMMIEGDPAKEYYQETLKKFGSDNVTVVFIRDKDLFTPAKLATCRNWSTPSRISRA